MLESGKQNISNERECDQNVQNDCYRDLITDKECLKKAVEEYRKFIDSVRELDDCHSDVESEGQKIQYTQKEWYKKLSENPEYVRQAQEVLRKYRSF